MKMIQKTVLIGMLSMCLLSACKQSPQTEAGAEQNRLQSGPQIKKIAIQNRAQADSLINRGLDVIVIEDDYVAVRLDEDALNALGAMSLNAEPIQEQDLIQRLVKIAVSSKENVNDLIALGMDIWEVREDTVIAQVYDKHILQAESKGYAVEIIERNAQAAIEKKAQK
ncbi:MAG: hypothetical protein ACE5IR_13370 [bacterium]